MVTCRHLFPQCAVTHSEPRQSVWCRRRSSPLGEIKALLTGESIMTQEGFALEQLILVIGAIIWMFGFPFMRRRKLVAPWSVSVLGGV